jgi:hypothetical protein
MFTRSLMVSSALAMLIGPLSVVPCPLSSNTTDNGQETTDRVKVLNLERLNTPADEDDPCLAPDGLRLFFSSNQSGNFDVMMAQKRPPRQNFFANPRPVEELNSKGDDASPVPLPREEDGSEYIFLARHDAKNFDIFFTRKLTPDEPYMRSALAGVLGVCTPADETHPWLVQVGKNPVVQFELYFSRKTSSGWRIGVARSDSPRTFDDKQIKLLDFPAGFAHPTVSADGKTMYVQGPIDDKRTGLFVCKRPSTSAAWGKPTPLTMLNSENSLIGDRSPSLSRPKGEFLYFASDRQGGKGGLDLYAVETRLVR